MTVTPEQKEAYGRLVAMRDQPDNQFVFVSQYSNHPRRHTRFRGNDLNAMIAEAKHFPGIVAIQRIDTPGVDVWQKEETQS